MADYYKNSDYYCSNDTAQGCAKGVRYSVVTDLATEPVSLEFFKEHARIDFDTDDNLCESYIKAARQELESWGQISFGVKTIKFSALYVPDDYNLMFGDVDEITTTGYENFGDFLLQGGEKVNFEYTTIGKMNEAIKIAICRYAAGLYINRETVTETEFSSQSLIDEAKLMIQPYINITWF